MGAWSGCGGGAFDPSTDDVGAAAEPVVVITNCTAAVISAAIVAGGDVLLNCGTAPITINMPTTTNVTHATRVIPVSSGPITFTHGPTLFTVNNNAAFELNNVKLTSSTGMGIQCSSGSATVNGVTFTSYRSFALIGHASTRLTVTGSTFTLNGTPSTGFGVPIYSEGANVDVRTSTFSGNQAGSSGGAINAFGGTLLVNDSTFYFNSASSGGAISSSSNSPIITNSTFWRNSSSVRSAAIQAPPSTIIRNCTFADNGSPQGSLAPGQQVFNSVLLDTVSPSSAPCQLAGTGNVEWPASMANCGPGFHFGDPKLGPLASNGGPTQTMALQPGSAAIDSAPNFCPPLDQRAVARPRDGDGNGSALCDVGAYER
jgi:predicted outer membrane repeat protein